MTYDEVKKKIEAEAALPPAKRTQPVPCAYCTRGGNGDGSCASGMGERKYSKYKSCFAGSLVAPNAKAKPADAAGTADVAKAKARRDAAMEAHLRDLVADQLCVHQDQVVREAALDDDLGADSIDRAEIAIEVESEFGVAISDDEVASLRTFGQLLDHLKGHATQWRPRAPKGAANE